MSAAVALENIKYAIVNVNNIKKKADTYGGDADVGDADVGDADVDDADVGDDAIGRLSFKTVGRVSGIVAIFLIFISY
jgi:hypothetical protein